MSEQEERQRVAHVARSLIGTPYRDGGMVPGINGGCDCATSLILIFSEAGLIERFTPEHYSAQWFLHQDRALYLEMVEKYAKEVSEPQIGDLVLYLVGRQWAHGGVIVDWPLIVHASKMDGQVMLAEWYSGFWGDEKKHPHRFFSIWL